MRIFQHLNSGKTIGLNYKVLNTFFDKNEKFKIIYDYNINTSINIDYFLIRHPTDRFISFYKNKLCDFIGFNYLSNSFILEISNLINIDLFIYKIKSPSNKVKEIFKQRETFINVVNNLSFYKEIEAHLCVQSKYINYIKYNKLIRIEKELNLLQEYFPDIDFSIKINTSYKEKIFIYLTSNLEEKIFKEYNNDYKIGNYKPYFVGV